MRRTCLLFLVLTSLATYGWAQDPPGPDEPPKFIISHAFLEDLRAKKTFLPTYKVRMEHRSDVKSLADDCEVHLAGSLQESFTFGEPPAVVVEPANLCKFKPNAPSPSTSNLTTMRNIWHSRLASDVLKKACEVTGFPRIYTEHLTSDPNEGAGTSNPNHVFEIHPATRIACTGEPASTFIKNLRSFPTLKHIQANSVHECITGLKLWVRFHAENEHYEFFQKRPAKCGNLAIVEVTSMPQEFIQPTGGGHTAIARIPTDGADGLAEALRDRRIGRERLARTREGRQAAA